MPRDGSGVYSLPFPDVVTATPIASTVFNGFEHDIATDLNAARPIVAGGTGGNSAAAARAALTVETYGQIVTNYDSMSFQPGSFYSDAAATSPPVAGHAFVGLCAFVDGNNMFLEAYDRDDTGSPGALWTRQKKAGTWGSWAKSQALTTAGTPAANAFTTWASSTSLQAVAISGLVKGNGASAPAAAAAGTDYAPATSGTALLKGNGAGGFSNAAAGTDYAGPPANPTGTIGLTAVNGSANTGMRSDAAPALSQAIVPTWSGAHTFNGTAQFNAQTTFDGQAVSPLQTLTDGATISTWDCSLGQKAKVTLGAAGRTMAAPSNMVEGTTYFLWVIQDATGSRTITTWNAVFDFGAAGAPTLSTTGNRADLLTFEALNIGGIKMRFTGIAKGFA